jgi:hypothetical protein
MFNVVGVRQMHIKNIRCIEGVSPRDEAMPNFVQRTSRLSVRKSTTRELERALGFRLNYCTSLHVFTRGSRPAAAFMHLCFR